MAIELELGIHAGLWASVAAGGALDGEGLDGADMAIAESLAGPVQTLTRLETDPSDIARVLERVARISLPVTTPSAFTNASDA